MKIKVENNIIAYLPTYVTLENNSIKELNTEISTDISTYDFDLESYKYSNEQFDTLPNEYDYFSDGEFSENEKYLEGSQIQITVNAYERNYKLRKRCIEIYGYICSVCEFDFRKVYGERGKGFIEVHHLKPLSEIKKQYDVSPHDLRPVCSNCHSMIHRFKNSIGIEELKEIIEIIKKVST